MEWVETTGKTVEEAVDSALDQLGVDEADAEYEILSEAKLGMFGRLKAEARIRARVRPTAPPSKENANNKRRRPSGKDRPAKGGSPRPPRESKSEETSAKDDVPATGEEETANRSRTKSRRKPATPRQGAAAVAEEEVPLPRQAEVASEFLTGLLGSIEITANISVSVNEEDEIVNLAVEGEGLGHLIGPKGATLHSLQEVTRTVVQRKTGARNGRIIVDISQYREKRREALERFSKQIAEEVLRDGGTKTLEPMNPADRKVVHDTIGEIDGVATLSEGEEPRRRVVVKNTSAGSSEVG